jgi:hypothetical protein
MSTPKTKKPKKTSPTSRSQKASPLPNLRSTYSLAKLLSAFKALLAQTHLQLALAQSPHSFYPRLFTPVITLWYLIFQRLNPDHCLEAALTNAHAGGADRLCRPQDRPLSARIRSLATTALSNARHRLPLSLLHATLAAQDQQVCQPLQHWLWRGWRVLLMDGSQIRLRPTSDISAHFAASANQHGKAYWVLMRVVVILCAHTGLALSSAVGSATLSEQALITPLLLQALPHHLYVGDANFGIFWILHTLCRARAQCLVRLTASRARKLLGSRGRFHGRFLDQPLCWTPSHHDQQHAGADAQPLLGRLIGIRRQRRGFRTRYYYLFTTLTDTAAYSPQALWELYGVRWSVELDLRYIKSQLVLDQLECKSADMAQKEWLAGLIAYNLIRSLMVAAALAKHLPLDSLSFSTTRRLLWEWLAHTKGHRLGPKAWSKLLDQVAQRLQPTYSQPRPNEPRRKRHVRETFPPLRGSRAEARRQLSCLQSKSL